ncbi:GntR family transcriptional regulator [Tropicimonas sp. TH_r6]|uniref:GntR family transcriptional regulator n=1 Tax=Tropicimonas sp. TH_r6 TaxID=3082085 RepID=UPI002955D64E|nr:GntR family transcriptional regulator [Tropicimonas sp. TH_r6]MDV7144042.1 GntR family transcriptional regulator [Tropicimonas sp. TH_r6]
MTSSRVENIVHELEDLIFDGTFSNGEKLDEVRLADRFDVSRTPLREALQRLAQSGLVELVPRRGAFVHQLGPLDLMEMFEVMAELEASCARLAARRITEDGLERLMDANNKCRDAVGSCDSDTYYAENECFHQIIYLEAGNGFLRRETKRLQKRLTPFRRKQLGVRGRMKESLREHETIVQSIAQNDADAAAQAMRDHVAVQGEKFHSLMAGLRHLG